MPRTKLPPQHDPYSIALHGVEYELPWDRMTAGSSFFLPTTATLVQARNPLKQRAQAVGCQIEVRERHEYGRYGLRVWRVD